MANLPGYYRATTTVTSAPAVEPVTVAYLRNYLRLDQTNDDDLLQDLIQEAREWAEARTRRALITQTLQTVFEVELPPYGDLSGPVNGPIISLPSDNRIYPGGLRLELPRPPLQSVSTVELEVVPDTDWETLTLNTDYTVDTGTEPGTLRLIISRVGWTGRVRTTYLAGYGASGAAVPSVIRRAICARAAHHYEGRDAQDQTVDMLGLDEYRIHRL